MFPAADLMFDAEKDYDLAIVLSDNDGFLSDIMDAVKSERTIVLTSRGKDVNVREGVIYYTYARNLENSIYFMDFIERLIFRIFLGGYITEDMEVILISDYPFKFILEFVEPALTLILPTIPVFHLLDLAIDVLPALL